MLDAVIGFLSRVCVFGGADLVVLLLRHKKPQCPCPSSSGTYGIGTCWSKVAMFACESECDSCSQWCLGLLFDVEAGEIRKSFILAFLMRV